MPPRGNSVRAGGAFVDITARISRQFRGVLASVRARFAKLSASLNRTAARIGAAAGAALLPVALLTKQFAKLGDEIGKTAKRTGFSTEAISRLKFAAEQSGSSITELEAGLKRMARFLIDSEDGLATNVRGLKRLNLEVSDFKGLKPEEQFLLFADRIGSMADATEKAALAQIVFGRAGTKLIPLFNEGADGIKRLGDEAASLGIVLDKETTQAAEDMTDGFNKLKVSLQAVAVVVGKTLAGDVKALTARMLDALAGVREWIKENKQFLLSLVAGALKALAFAAALKAVAVVLALVAAFLTPGAAILAGLAALALLLPDVRQGFSDMLDISSSTDEHLSAIDKIELAWVTLRLSILGAAADINEGLANLATIATLGLVKATREAAKEAAIAGAQFENQLMSIRSRIKVLAQERSEQEKKRKGSRKVEDERRAASDVFRNQLQRDAKQTERDEDRIQKRLAEIALAAEVGTDLDIALGNVGKISAFGPTFKRTRGIVADVGKTFAETGGVGGLKSQAQIDAAALTAGEAVGTFSSRFASQLVGGERIQRKQLSVAEDSQKTLLDIERNTAGGARFAAP